MPTVTADIPYAVPVTDDVGADDIPQGVHIPDPVGASLSASGGDSVDLYVMPAAIDAPPLSWAHPIPPAG